MLNLGLRAGEYRRYLDLLADHHWVFVRVMVVSITENYLADLSNRLEDGQVDIDTEGQDYTRSCQLVLFDPEAQLNFDTESPTNGALFHDRMIYVVYTVASPDMSFHVDVPIFRGPVAKLDRDGDVINVEAHGKETLARGEIGKPRTYKKGWRIAAVIESIMKTQAGESRTSIKNTSGPRLPRNYSTSRERTPWQSSKSLAAMRGQHLFYDGRGFCRLRPTPRKRVYTFRSGRDGVIKTKPQAGYDMSGLKNVVRVIGHKPKGKNKKRVTFTLNAPRNHPLSPWSLGRPGAPLRLVEEIQDDSIRTKKEAKRVARARMRSLLVETVDVAFDALPVPHLEENDVCGIVTPDFSGTMRLRKMSIPLTVKGTASIGYNRRLTPSRSRIRRR